MKRTTCLPVVFAALLLSFVPLLGQQLSHVQGEILVQLDPEVNPRIWATGFERLDGKSTGFAFKKIISAPVHIYSFTFNHIAINEFDLLRSIRRHPAVVTAQFNHFVTMRAIPNDEQFPEQWQYINTGQSGGTPGADLDIEEAWDITTGGLTADGDTIVVCAIDGGLDLDHEDFEDNHWTNHAEIPGNNIDDDLNGYIDDYRGWNVGNGNDNINDNSGHGTAVAGIIGAKGNNEIGVTGVSWNVKVMVVKNGSVSDEAEVLEAYTYPLIMRMRYNESNGAEGAFVVATNASWGINYGDPEDSPLWCAFYDTLGVHGILNCGATINGNVDVDEEGDLPTACPSDYLISVTNMNDDDQKVGGAGYGATTIDLGAFGARTWTTDAGNDYDDFGGTSGATPHVTGTIGLLYAAPCPALMAIAKSDPGAAALLLKQYIMEGVDPNESLDGITVTGGRLNINNSLQLLMANCGDCPKPSSLSSTAITDTSAMLSWIVNDSINTVDLRWRALGDTTWTNAPNVSSPYSLSSLLACTTYEFQLKPYCHSDTLDFGYSQFFETDGCCELPEAFQLVPESTTQNETTFSWNSVLIADSYNLQIKSLDSNDWLGFNTIDTFFTFSGLDICTLYEVQVQTVCSDTTVTSFSASQMLQTSGCGPCVEADYCMPINLSSDEEWIGLVEIGPLSNASESDDGYGNYTLLPSTAFQVGETYPLMLDPDFLGFSFSQDFHVWVDLNQDAVFASDELLYSALEASGNVQAGELTIPGTALLGNTRLRVAMQHGNVLASCEFDSGAFGEVEDYCIEIVPETSCGIPALFDTTGVDPTEATLGWEPIGAAISYVFRYKKTTDPQWSALSVINSDLSLAGLEPCTEYEAQIRTVCGNTQGAYTPSIFFTTDCVISSASATEGMEQVIIYPNPFSTEVNVELYISAATSQVKVQLINTLGRIVEQQELSTSGRQKAGITFKGEHLAPGIYFIRLINDKNESITRKVVRF